MNKPKLLASSLEPSLARLSLGLCIYLGLAAGTVHAQAPAQTSGPTLADPIVLRAGSFQLTKSEYEKLAPGFERASGAVTTGTGPRSLQSGTDVARLLALVSEAQKRGLDKDPTMQALLRVRTYTLLANSLLPALTAEVRKDVAGTRALWETEKEKYFDLRARQILVRYKGAATETPSAKPATRNEAEARTLAGALHERIKQGADVAALAKSSSDDEGTRAKGGEMPPFGRGNMIGEFEVAAFGTPVGSISAPFKTKYGWHIVQVLERRYYPFESIRTTLEFQRAQSQFEAIANTGIKLDEAYFVP